MKLHTLTAKEWGDTSEEAHLLCFEELRPREMNRIDFALMVTNEDQPIAYMTCKELDAESVYMQHGGTLNPEKRTLMAYRAYEVMMDYLKYRYKRGSTLIENENVGMLKAAMMQGLRIVGVKVHNGKILVEHAAEWA